MNLHPASIVPGTAHRYITRVYFADTDSGGVVYHATYLAIAERARTEALRDLGVPHAELTATHGLMFMVRRVTIDYLAAARLDDSLVVATWPARIGHASIDLRQTVFRGDEALMAAQILLVCVRRDDTRQAGFAATRVPDRWRAALTRLDPASHTGLAAGPNPGPAAGETG